MPTSTCTCSKCRIQNAIPEIENPHLVFCEFEFTIPISDFEQRAGTRQRHLPVPLFITLFAIGTPYFYWPLLGQCFPFPKIPKSQGILLNLRE
jgi:hypothetical protein